MTYVSFIMMLVAGRTRRRSRTFRSYHFADWVVIDRLEEAVDALGPAGPGHVLGWRKAGLVSLDGVAPDLGGSSKSKK